MLGKTPPKQVQATILQGVSPDDFNDIGSENKVIPEKITLEIENDEITLPPHSLTFIPLDLDVRR
ncbi:MAG: hypothetical protein ACRC2T_00210 [Thermoguttaceae bacterium]